jgi:hypothetical protein
MVSHIRRGRVLGTSSLGQMAKIDKMSEGSGAECNR